MDYRTACKFLMTQVNLSNESADAFLARLQQGKSPVPGQTTNILLALKVVFEGLRYAEKLDRDLVYALYVLAHKSQQAFEAGQAKGVDWTPLLEQDLKRIARAVKSIFAGVWHNA